MNTHELIPVVFIIVFLGFAAWSVARGRRWERYQQEAAGRAKMIVEKTAEDSGRFEQVMSVSQQQLQLLKELLQEIKALRADLKQTS
jgi:hypothetical protein